MYLRVRFVQSGDYPSALTGSPREVEILDGEEGNMVEDKGETVVVSLRMVMVEVPKEAIEFI